MSDGTRHLPVAIGDDWEGRHHDHSTEVEPSWAVAQLVARNHNLTAILTDLIAELRELNVQRLGNQRCQNRDGGMWAEDVHDAADRAEARLKGINDE